MQHTSRHSLGTQASYIAALPFAPPGPQEGERGHRLAHKLVAVGGFAEEAQQHRLSILDVQAECDGRGAAQSAALEELAAWVVEAPVTALEARDLGGGSAVIVAGSSNGALYRLRLLLPQTPGADPSQCQVTHQSDFQGPELVPWFRPHRGAVTDADIRADTVLSVGLDGAIWLATLGEDAPRAPFVRPCRSVSYDSARWCSHDTFVTAGTTGGVESWDRRQGPTPTAHTPPEQGHTGFAALDAEKGAARHISCLATHARQPHLVAAGSGAGGIAIWDLRRPARPLHTVLGGSQEGRPPGEVLKVLFDTYEQQGSSATAVPPLLFCTSGGHLASSSVSSSSPYANGFDAKHTAPASEDGGGWEGEAAEGGAGEAAVLHSEPCGGIASLALDPATGQDIFCVTDQEGLVFLQRPLQ